MSDANRPVPLPLSLVKPSHLAPIPTNFSIGINNPSNPHQNVVLMPQQHLNKQETLEQLKSLQVYERNKKFNTGGPIADTHK